MRILPTSLLLTLALAASAEAAPVDFSATVTTPITGLSVPQGLASGDINGDGRQDLVVANLAAGTLAVQTNLGGGAFSSDELVAGGTPVAVAIGDLNKDGRADLASVSFLTGDLDLLIQQPSGGWEPITLPAGNRPTGVAIGDLNGDGFKDVAVNDAAADDNDVYNLYLYVWNPGTSSYDTTTLPNFHDAGLGGPGDVAIGDLNGDGRNDLATANGSNEDGNTVSVFYKNAGAGYTQKFLSIPGRHAAVSITIGDLGGSGPGADLAAAFNAGVPDSVGIWTRDPSDPSGYKAQTLTAPTSANIPAFNGIVIAPLNGRPAVAAANTVGKNVTVWTRAIGATTFTPTVIATPDQSTGLAAADFTGDGRVDLATSQLSSGGVALLSNTTPPTVPATVGGSVPATLSLSVGGPATFAPFTPGIAGDYTTSTSANVISSAGDAALSFSDPGHLANGSFTLPQPLVVELSKSTWSAPVSNDRVTVTFKQHINNTDALRTGAYSKTLTFTLSTTTP